MIVDMADNFDCTSPYHVLPTNFSISSLHLLFVFFLLLLLFLGHHPNNFQSVCPNHPHLYIFHNFFSLLEVIIQVSYDKKQIDLGR